LPSKTLSKTPCKQALKLCLGVWRGGEGFGGGKLRGK